MRSILKTAARPSPNRRRRRFLTRPWSTLAPWWELLEMDSGTLVTAVSDHITGNAQLVEHGARPRSLTMRVFVGVDSCRSSSAGSRIHRNV